MIEVIKDKKDWTELLALTNHSDFYHTYDYHYLSKEDGEHPILIKYTDGQNTIVLPLLLRDIENSNYKDATSVYGYVGLLVINKDDTFNKTDFHKELNAFFNENKIISVFSRLHPFLDEQEAIHEGLGTITSLGKVVFKDLTDSLEDQRAQYNRRLKTYLNKSRKLCTVIKGNTQDHLEQFVALYIDNMKRVDADSSYFFSLEYFKKLLSSDEINAELLLCIHNETQEIIAGAIFIKTDEIVQYHLSGMSEEYFDLNPIKLIIDEMRIEATNEGFKYFNLGGGKSSREDSLFRFKSAFSKDFRVFRIWKYIVDETAYRTLSENHAVDTLNPDDLTSGFFPAYRAPLDTVSN